MKHIAIASFGNPLRQDDGIPEIVVRELEEQRFLNADYYYGEPLNYLSRLSSYDAVFIIDSVLSPDPVGSVKLLDLAHVSGPGFSTHSVSIPLVKQVLEDTHAYLIGIVIRERGYSDRPSEGLMCQLNVILENVKQAILSCL